MLVVSFILFIFLLAKTPPKESIKENKSQSYNTDIQLAKLSHPGALAVGEEEFLASQKRYRRNPDKIYFACMNEASNYNICISIKEKSFILFQIRNQTSTMYSKGSFTIDSTQGAKVYTFISQQMSALEAYYRFKKISFSGTFCDASDNLPLGDWESMYAYRRVYESWRLVEEDGYLKDSYSDIKFILQDPS
jgi:hypothetical protein